MIANTRVSGRADSAAEQRPPFVAIVGVELDETGAAALREALALVDREPGATLHLVHVVTDVDGALRSEANAHDRASMLEQRMYALRGFVVRHWRAFPPGAAKRVMLHVGLGDRERELVQFAVDYDADLLLVGTHGRGRLAKLISPSLAETLVRSAPCPVLIARPKDYGGLAKSPAIEDAGPPSTRSAGHHRRRGYRYSESLPFHTHDSNVIPTGVEQP